MKISLRALLSATAMLIAGANVGQAADLKFDDFEPFAKAASTTEITLVDHVGCDGNDHCCAPQPHVGQDFFTCTNRCGGIFFGSEMSMLRPFGSDDILAPGAANNADMGYRAAYRFWAGYESSSGLGGRLRSFVYDHFTTTATSALNLEFRYFDAELTQAVDFRRWNLLVSGGVRQAETNLATTAPGSAQVISGFDGLGLTFATQAVRDINTSRTMRFLASGRWSALYGNSKGGTSTGGVPPIGFDRDDLVNVLEINIGPQYYRTMRNGSTLIFGSGLEAQYWSNGVDVSAAGTDDIGFAGFSSSFTYMR